MLFFTVLAVLFRIAFLLVLLVGFLICQKLDKSKNIYKTGLLFFILYGGAELLNVILVYGILPIINNPSFTAKFNLGPFTMGYILQGVSYIMLILKLTALTILTLGFYKEFKNKPSRCSKPDGKRF